MIICFYLFLFFKLLGIFDIMFFSGSLANSENDINGMIINNTHNDCIPFNIGGINNKFPFFIFNGIQVPNNWIKK
jgi:hypothetical protein